jgi:DNA-binding NtrC family response regulator
MANRILLFHNDLEFLSSAEVTLRAEGFEVVAVKNGLTAWEMLSDVHRQVDVLVTGVAGSEGSPPGLALARHFRLITPRARVVIADTPDNARLAYGVGHVVVGCVSADDVLKAVRAALASRTPNAAENA